MKFVGSLAFVALLLVATVGATEVESLRGSIDKNVEKSVASEMSSQPESAEITQEHVRKLLFKGEKVNVIAVYKNGRGKKKIKKKAFKVKNESIKYKYVSMEATPEDIEVLINDPDIETIELDYEMKAIEDINVEQEHRELQESIPWGITKVQANNVTPNPGPDADQIKVCVVDTGK